MPKQNNVKLVVKSAVKAGAMINHNPKRIVVKSAVKAGTRTTNHNAKRL